MRVSAGVAATVAVVVSTTSLASAQPQSRTRRAPITVASKFGSVKTNSGRYCRNRRYCPLQLPPAHPQPRLGVTPRGRLRISLAFQARRVQIGFCRPEPAFHTLRCVAGRMARPFGPHGRRWYLNMPGVKPLDAAIVEVLYRRGSVGYLSGLRLRR